MLFEAPPFACTACVFDVLSTTVPACPGPPFKKPAPGMPKERDWLGNLYLGKNESVCVFVDLFKSMPRYWPKLRNNSKRTSSMWKFQQHIYSIGTFQWKQTKQVGVSTGLFGSLSKLPGQD